MRGIRYCVIIKKNSTGVENDRKLKKTTSLWKRQKARLIVVAGRKKSGKDVLVNYIMKRYPGFKHYRIAEAPVLIAKILELPPDRATLHKLFEINALLYPVLGKSAYMRRVSILLDRERPKFAIVEAIRTKEEYKEFVVKRKGILIGVAASDMIRYERALKDAKNSSEKRDEGKMTFWQFMQKENSPIEREVAWIIKRANFLLENSHKTKTPFYKAVKEVMRELGFR